MSGITVIVTQIDVNLSRIIVMFTANINIYVVVLLKKLRNCIHLCKQLQHCGITLLLFQLEICHRLSDITEMVTQIEINLRQIAGMFATDIYSHLVVLLKDIA